MRPRGSQHHPRRTFGRLRVPSERSGGGFGMVLGLSQAAPERSWTPLGFLLGCLGKRFGFFLLMFETQGGVRSENSEKLEFDDRLTDHAMFLRSQGLRNETKIVPKRAKRRKKSR